MNRPTHHVGAHKPETFDIDLYLEVNTQDDFERAQFGPVYEIDEDFALRFLLAEFHSDCSDDLFSAAKSIPSATSRSMSWEEVEAGFKAFGGDPFNG